MMSNELFKYTPYSQNMCTLISRPNDRSILYELLAYSSNKITPSHKNEKRDMSFGKSNILEEFTTKKGHIIWQK